eukprot:Skav201970  [mRNA]  locus=scaffold103:281171:281542:- [translate_table: standard]
MGHSYVSKDITTASSLGPLSEAVAVAASATTPTSSPGGTVDSSRASSDSFVGCLISESPFGGSSREESPFDSLFDSLFKPSPFESLFFSPSSAPSSAESSCFGTSSAGSLKSTESTGSRCEGS